MFFFLISVILFVPLFVFLFVKISWFVPPQLSGGVLLFILIIISILFFLVLWKIGLFLEARSSRNKIKKRTARVIKEDRQAILGARK